MTIHSGGSYVTNPLLCHLQTTGRSKGTRWETRSGWGGLSPQACFLAFLLLPTLLHCALLRTRAPPPLGGSEAPVTASSGVANLESPSRPQSTQRSDPRRVWKQAWLAAAESHCHRRARVRSQEVWYKTAAGHLGAVCRPCGAGAAQNWWKSSGTWPTGLGLGANYGNFLKRREYQSTWPASWEICMQVKKQQLESDMEQQTGSKGVHQSCILSRCLFKLICRVHHATCWPGWNQDCREKYQ